MNINTFEKKFQNKYPYLKNLFSHIYYTKYILTCNTCFIKCWDCIHFY